LRGTVESPIRGEGKLVGCDYEPLVVPVSPRIRDCQGKQDEQDSNSAFHR
jgi:hypothetical protein